MQFLHEFIAGVHSKFHITGADIFAYEVEQYSRQDNIVFRGVPESDGESTTDVVRDISAMAGVAYPSVKLSSALATVSSGHNQQSPVQSWPALSEGMSTPLYC